MMHRILDRLLSIFRLFFSDAFNKPLRFFLTTSIAPSTSALRSAMQSFNAAFCFIMLMAVMGCASQPTRYQQTTSDLSIPQAPYNYKKVRVALINFRDLTGKEYLMDPATSQLTSIMIQSGYFDIIEPTLVEKIIENQSDISQEKLALLKEKFSAQYFLTGTLTNFEIRENQSGFCLMLGLAGGYSKNEYIVETGIDYRLVSVPSANIAKAGVVENRRVDTSQAAGVLFSYGGNDVRVLKSNSGKLLRYAMRDLVLQLIESLPH